jgi:ATP-dependent helicase HrpA
VDQLLVEHGGPAWDDDGFGALLSTVRAGFVAAALSSARLVGEILASAASIEATLAAMLTEAHDESVLDARAHLDRLLHQGWISAAGFDRLPDLARYLRALEHRVAKARTQPDRDRRHIATIQALEQEYKAVAAHDTEGTVRTMLEELRVSTFAQSQGAKGGVSEPKVRAALAHLT